MYNLQHIFLPTFIGSWRKWIYASIYHNLECRFVYHVSQQKHTFWCVYLDELSINAKFHYCKGLAENWIVQSVIETILHGMKIGKKITECFKIMGCFKTIGFVRLCRITYWLYVVMIGLTSLSESVIYYWVTGIGYY